MRSNRNRAKGRCNDARKGMVLIAVMAFLLIAIMMILAWLKAAALERRTFRTLVERSQADWLAESAIDRAVAQLQIDPDYQGETWEISAADLQGKDSAIVVITVTSVADQAEVRKISVRADYPTVPERRNRRSKTIEIPMEQGDSK
jgi:Tfp pilus assembly protein PilX